MDLQTIVNITDIQTAVSQLSLQEFITVIKPLVIFVIGVVIYSIIVFKFYRFISKRDIFELKLYRSREKALKIVSYIFEHLIIFPIFVFLWFAILSIMLALISEIYSINNIFMASMAIVTTIRITAYYNEELSRDLAKLLPLAFLAVVVLDYAQLSIPLILNMVKNLPNMVNVLLYYLIFVLFLEIILRIFSLLWGSKQKDQNVPLSIEKSKF